MSHQNTIPSVRFREFQDPWEEHNLGSLATFSKGKGISKAEIVEGGRTECIRYGQLYTDYNEVIEDIISQTNEDPTDLVLSEQNDVIIPASGESEIDIATASCVIKSGVALGGDLNIIKSDANGIFLAYYLNNARKRDIARLAQGISVVHLYASQLKDLGILLPNQAEQQKIASFLTAVDKRIQLLQKKKAQLERYKKGVMQKLFSQEIRFKDEGGNDFPEWEFKKAKDVFLNHSNKDHNGELPILSASQEQGMIYRDESGIKIQSSEKSVKSYKVVEPNDFVISLRSFQGGIDFSEIHGICSPAYTILKNSIPVDYQFYKFYFKKEGFIERLSKTVVGIRDGKQITYVNFGTLTIPYPSVGEQKRISSFLNELDNSISKVVELIDASHKFKKGLLQKMFV